MSTPQPSSGAGCTGPGDWDDLCTAKKLKQPVYTVATTGIYKITPDGTITQEEGKDWRDQHKDHAKKKCECK
jgi:hypothetical protein